MYRFQTFILVSLFSIICLSIAGCTAHSKKERYVVVLSMDGFRSDYPSHAHTPTLDSLACVGVKAAFRPSFPSVTFPNHYSMATGLHPDHHGLVNNFFYAPDLDSVYVMGNPNPAFFGGEPIWNTAERQGLTANIFMWPGSEVPIGGRQATVWTRYSSKPDYYQRADWVIDAMTRPEAEIPELVMWYFEEPDAAMHTYGPESPEAVGRAEHIDSVLRYFFREIRRSPVFDRINFIVTADHGMAELSPDRYINLLPLLDTAQVVRVVPGTPFGLEVKEEYADQAVRTLRRTGHMKAWRRERMPRRFHYGTHPTRLTNVIVIPETGWTLDYAPQERPVRKRGTHGFDNRDRDMHMVFYGSGPAFRKGYRQRSFQNQNMYLILCRLLGIEPAPNDGEWRDIKRMFNEN